MKIVQLIHGLSMGGAETLVRDYCLGLHKMEDIDLIVVVCFTRFGTAYEQQLKEAGVRVIYVGEMIPQLPIPILGKIWNKLCLYFYTARILRQIKPDVIHSHLGLLDYIRLACLPPTTRLVYTQHNDVSNLHGDPTMRHLRWFLRHWPTQLIALNEDMRQQLNELFGVQNTVVVNNGLYLSRFQNRLPRVQARQKLNIAPDAFVLGHVGRLDTVKNHSFILDVFAQLTTLQPKAHLLLIGHGPLRSAILAKAETLGLSDKITLLTNRADIPDLLSAMNAFIFPSHQEGLGMAVVEAQVCGLPSLCSTGVPQAACISNKCAFRSLNDSPAQWAEQILAMAANTTPITYTHLHRWDMQHIVSQLKELYTNCQHSHPTK